MTPAAEGPKSSAIGCDEIWLRTSQSFLEPFCISVERLSPAALAYLGDAVYELYMRTCYLIPPRRIQAYHRLVVAQVRAEAQAQHLESLASHLTDAEKEILRRGRNATPKRRSRAAPEIYQQATSFETLIGYLYLTDIHRLKAVLALLELPATE
ncbi:MAG: ribonuclease III [Leptolyngbyaceae cyanobacterium SM1_1_3]|nr:ribonuclease III [Leptolyngbyaceae cyanobacterium SM1_1_3]NJN03706.1 ribonuclease III [Leptolyngbyaceae cyanobacterium RM1_1_2]NJO09334.1 ribonuclease III [Leptolyngbyaceae cyanobacterium SL_1_1]